MSDKKPKTAIPPDACDSHLHVYDRSYPSRVPVDDYTGEDYRRLWSKLGFSRAVVVQPRAYWTDNSLVVDTVKLLGKNNARGIAVIHPDIPEQELQALHAGGVRGVRFSMFKLEHLVVGFDMVEPIAARIRALGWHVQLHWKADQIVEHRKMLERLSVPLVFDHMGRIPPAKGLAHPAFEIMRDLAANNRAWVKLTAGYLDSATGLATGYRDIAPIVRAWVAAVPHRLVWGSDWPHLSELHDYPRVADLFDLFAEWVPDTMIRNTILVDNPATLYGFEPLAAR